MLISLLIICLQDSRVLAKGFYSLIFSVLFELELLKRVISIPVHLWNIKTTHIGKHKKHGALISLLLCRSDTIKKMSFGLTSNLSHFLYSDSQIKARLFKLRKKNILRQEIGHLCLLSITEGDFFLQFLLLVYFLFLFG